MSKKISSSLIPHPSSPKKLVVGLTGGIASGKSTALREFKKCGAHVICLDESAHQVLEPGEKGYSPVVRAFGKEILDVQKRIDRHRLGQRVFQNTSQLRRLESITHPLILQKMKKRVGGVKKGVVIVDVPLLFEKHLQSLFDLTILVYADSARQLKRLWERNGFSRREALRRFRSQWSMQRKEGLADLILRNTQRKRHLAQQVREFYRAFELLMAHN
ncbi:MAG: dephospho-CoA kinase [Elusimicrobia bacterium]|nr:dephospho-CoA kinase [Elusimicrobiota bacterium]